MKVLGPNSDMVYSYVDVTRVLKILIVSAQLGHVFDIAIPHTHTIYWEPLVCQTYET